MQTSKYFCQAPIHLHCSHDWDQNTTTIVNTIGDLSISDLDHHVKELYDHDDDREHEDDKDLLIIQLMKELQIAKCHSESYWQRKLFDALNANGAQINRRFLKKHKFITDLSSDHVLIEIKHEKDFRTAVGQIADYAEMLRQQQQNKSIWFKYILLFGNRHHWSQELWRDRQRLCARAGIILRWLI